MAKTESKLPKDVAPEVRNEIYQGAGGASLGEAAGEELRIESIGPEKEPEDFKADPARAEEVAKENPKVVNASDPDSREDETIGGRSVESRAEDATDPLFGDEAKLNFNVRTFFSDLAELGGKVWLEFHGSLSGIGGATEKLYKRVSEATHISEDELEARYEVRTKKAPDSAEQTGFISAFCRRV